MNSKTTKIIFIVIFIILNVADIVTAYVAQHDLLETNPIVVFTGQLWILLLVKIFVGVAVVLIIWLNKWSSERWMFFFLMAMSYFVFFLAIGVYSNLLNVINPVPPEQYLQVKEAVTTGVKLASYVSVTKTYYIRPVFLGFIAFIVFEKLYPDARFKKKRLIQKKDEE